MSFPMYEEYRDSGIAWVGRYPAHWGSLRTKTLFELMRRPPREEDGVVTAFRDGEVTLRTNRRTDGFTNSLQEIGYQGVRCGDLVIHAMDAFAGAIGVSDSDGKSTPVYSVCKPRQGLSDSRYYARLLRHMALSGFIESLAKGIRERSTEFRWAEAGNVYLPVPPVAEQTTIANFLDAETAKIDALIAEQEKLIALLAEKRQATISHAVTKGLNPSVPMKESGVAWLGEAPTHWRVKQLKHVAKPGTSITYGIVQAGPHWDGGIPYIKTSDMSGDKLPLDGYSLTSPEIDASYSRSKVTTGDIVIAIRATVGKCLPVPPELAGANLTQGTAKVSPGDEVSTAFLLSSLRSTATQTYFDSMAKGATFKEITLDALRRTPVLVPPPEEQQSIVQFIEVETNKLNALQCASESAMNLLRERRSALIAAAVTGQIDVRGL